MRCDLRWYYNIVQLLFNRQVVLSGDSTGYSVRTEYPCKPRGKLYTNKIYERTKWFISLTRGQYHNTHTDKIIVDRYYRSLRSLITLVVGANFIHLDLCVFPRGMYHSISVDFLTNVARLTTHLLQNLAHHLLLILLLVDWKMIWGRKWFYPIKPSLAIKYFFFLLKYNKM